MKAVFSPIFITDDLIMVFLISIDQIFKLALKFQHALYVGGGGDGGGEVNC